MSTAYFISHPEVRVDPAMPVPLWSLSEVGAARMRAFAESPLAQGLASVWASEEAKAVEAAQILADRLVLPVRLQAALHENDRSATGFLPPEEFQRTADAFFAQPERSIRGWETAAHAQDRIAAAVQEVLAQSPAGDIAIIAHGGVGTLLLCRMLGIAINRREDQPFQGCCWAFEIATRHVLHRWRSITPARGSSGGSIPHPDHPRESGDPGVLS